MTSSPIDDEGHVAGITEIATSAWRSPAPWNLTTLPAWRGARDAGAMIMATAPFPHRYSVTLEDSELAADTRPRIHVGVAPQFGGTADVWSPEHLFVASALTCLKMTFDAYARREQIAVREWRGVATGVLAKGAGGPVFTSIDLDIAIVTEAGDEARAQSVLSSAERKCIISRMLNVPVHVTGKITAPPGRAAG